MRPRRWRFTYFIVHENLALLLAGGFDNTNGSDGVESGDAEFLFAVDLLLGLLRQSGAVLLLELLRLNGSLRFPRLGDAIGGRSLRA